MGIKDDFMSKTKMIDSSGQKNGIEEMMDYLCEPSVVSKMLIASDMELPVLTLVAKGIEDRFDDKSNLSVVNRKGNSNATARQNVGRMVKHIMRQYGYTPIDGGLSERARIPAISESKYFSTSAIYKKTEEAKYEIKISSNLI